MCRRVTAPFVPDWHPSNPVDLAHLAVAYLKPRACAPSHQLGDNQQGHVDDDHLEPKMECACVRMRARVRIRRALWYCIHVWERKHASIGGHLLWNCDLDQRGNTKPGEYVRCKGRPIAPFGVPFVLCVLQDVSPQ